MAYCLEEPPYFATDDTGSYIHAKSLHDNHVSVLGMICFEMIGYLSDEPGSQGLLSFELAKTLPDTANFIVTVGMDTYDAFNRKIRDLMSRAAKTGVYNVSFAEQIPEALLAGMSDQRNYRKFGFPALMINDTSFVRYPHYRQPTDTVDTLDFDRMTEVVTGAFNAVIHPG